MAAATLTEAALNAAVDMTGKFGSGILVTRLTNFCTALDAQFPGDGTESTRTVSNWIPIIRASIQGLSNVRGLPAAIDAVFRICFAASWASTQGRITGAQAAAILAAYNAQLA